MIKTSSIIVIAILILSAIQLRGQISEKGIPISFSLKNIASSIPEVVVQAPDVEKLKKEDHDGKTNLPNRFAVLLPVDLGLDNSGLWEYLPDGSRLWRLKIRSENALALGLYFDDFFLPEGAKLFLYDNNMGQVKGAYTNKNNHSNRLFVIELVKGDITIIELYLPIKTKKDPVIHINELAYAYRGVYGASNVDEFGGSDPCEVNVNCSPEGDNWKLEKQSVVKIHIKKPGAAVHCTGTLLNNTNFDFKPYILTADHCATPNGVDYPTEEELSQWMFYFNYESATCENPDLEPVPFTLKGAKKMANGGKRGQTGSDFYLVLLDKDIPADFNAYYSGWSALDSPSDDGVTIHHPEGDIKKISTYTEEITTSGYFGNNLPSHWQVYWAETENNWGVTEGGSSGSPLFNSEGKVIGSLTGGFAACDLSGVLGPDKPDYYGKFSYHWESNGDADSLQLKPWLDPGNTGDLVLNGTSVGIDSEIIPDNSIINVYPNPATDYININFTNFEAKEIYVEIFDLIGKPVKEFTFEYVKMNERIDITDIQPGIYFVKTEFNRNIIVKRIVKR